MIDGASPHLRRDSMWEYNATLFDPDYCCTLRATWICTTSHLFCCHPRTAARHVVVIVYFWENDRCKLSFCCRARPKFQRVPITTPPPPPLILADGVAPYLSLERRRRRRRRRRLLQKRKRLQPRELRWVGSHVSTSTNTCKSWSRDAMVVHLAVIPVFCAPLVLFCQAALFSPRSFSSPRNQYVFGSRLFASLTARVCLSLSFGTDKNNMHHIRTG